MNRIIQLLWEQPFLALLLIGWLLGAVGGVLKRSARRAADRRQREQAPSPSQSQSLPASPQRRRPSSEEVAAEMRRILGMDPPARAQPVPQRRVPPPAPPVRRPVVAAPTVVVPPPKPVSRIGELQARLEREDSRAGNLGSRDIGTLGGRGTLRQQLRHSSAGLINLNDLPRQFVMMEVLGKPLALRQDW